MYTAKFFKLFPPPKYMVMRHAGLEISDDAIRCLKYTLSPKGWKIDKYSTMDIDSSLVLGGDIVDEKGLCDSLSKFAHDHALSYVKVSVPEEKAYLFQTDVPDADLGAIAQNIEFKLEENVPLTAADAVFYFDILPLSVTGGALRASVSVVPRAYIEHMITLLRGIGLSPVSFEVVPKAIARAIIQKNTDNTIMIVHIMNNKTGIYIVSGGVVCFTSTVAGGGRNMNPGSDDISALTKEISRIHTYWMSHCIVDSSIEKIVLLGKGALAFEGAIKKVVSEVGLTVTVPNVWENAFSLDEYVPPISKEDSLDYSVVAGLAMNL